MKNNIEMLKEISEKAYRQLEESLLKVKEISILYNEEKKEVYDLYKKAAHLKNHVVMLDDIGYYSMLLTLSSQGITLTNKLLDGTI